MGILKKHGDNNYYDNTFSDFQKRLEAGSIGVAMLKHYDLYGSHCVTCDDPVTAFKYRGERYDLHQSGGLWIIHQCQAQRYDLGPEEGQDEPQRDGDGRIVGGGWTDPGPEPDQFPDDPYMYPDIPYVSPWK